MEDEGFVDDDFIEETARECRPLWAQQHIHRERAGIAEVAGDYLIVQTWRAIAEAAERMME
jgi:hypothetical protein